jgi:SAM-dependent methyltransferase
MYEEFFRAVLNIHGGRGWYEPNDARTDMDYKTKHYPGVLAKIDYDHLAVEEAPFAARLAEWIKDTINPTRVLDLGCGPGIYTHALVDRGINAQGLDIDERVDGRLHILRGDLLESRWHRNRRLGPVS